MNYAIPTIDIALLRGGDTAEKRRVIQEVGEAARIYGFMKLINHGVPESVIADAYALGERFFDQPDETKRLVMDQRTNRGFIPMFDSVVNGNKPTGHEAFSMGHPQRPSDPALLSLPFYVETPWPDLPGFREALVSCYNGLFGVGETVLEAFAVYLGADPGFFAQVSQNTYSNMRVLHYPPKEAVQAVTDVGVHAHEDQGLITLLFQDNNGGLEVLGPDDTWLPVLPDERAIVLNVGKLLTRWTNGRLRSALHRVINSSGRERYSIPLFVHPNYHQVINPRDFSEGQEPKFEAIVAGEQVYSNFMKQRVSWQKAAS